MRGVFGDPGPYIRSDGTVDHYWETKILTMASLPSSLRLAWDHNRTVNRFRCHYLLKERFEAAFQKAHADGPGWDSIGDFGGCYMFRPNRKNPRALSFHAWGAAVDIDVADNGQGHSPEMHPAVIWAFESEGFIWGGRFHGDAVDGMHFEYGSQMLEMIMLPQKGST